MSERELAAQMHHQALRNTLDYMAVARDVLRLAAVRAVLGERRHEGVPGQYRDRAVEWCSPCGQLWPCLHERVRRAVEGEPDAAGEAQP